MGTIRVQANSLVWSSVTMLSRTWPEGVLVDSPEVGVRHSGQPVILVREHISPPKKAIFTIIIIIKLLNKIKL